MSTTQAGRTVTVLPETFTLVNYDSATIAELAAAVAERIGLPATLRLAVEVDETTLLGWSTLAEVDPQGPSATLKIESGALEDAHHPRQFSERGALDVFGRHLLRLKDRLNPEFGQPGEDADIPLRHKAAWDTYAVGRMARLGYPVQRQRRLYQFRVRHGFNDAVDAAFVHLWNGSDLSWDDIVEASDTVTSTHTS